MDKVIQDLKKEIEIELNEAKIMYTITNSDKYKDEIIFQTVLYNWLKDVETVKDYKKKLDSFKKICDSQKLIDLFMQIMRIENIKRYIINKDLINNNIYNIDKSDVYNKSVKGFESTSLVNVEYPNIDFLIEEYNELINDSNYTELSKDAGWGLSSDFSNRNNYFNSSLFKQIEFFNTFKSKLFIINDQIASYCNDEKLEDKKEGIISGKRK